MKTKKISAILLACMMMFSICPLDTFSVAASAATTTSGTTGDCTWTIDDTVLTISGEGNMADYDFAETPWWDYSIDENIVEIVIENGVTTLTLKLSMPKPQPVPKKVIQAINSVLIVKRFSKRVLLSIVITVTI